MLSCETIQGRLIAALDEGVLDDEVEGHCVECASCRNTKRQFEMLLGQLDALPKPPFKPAEAFVEELHAVTEQSGDPASGWRAFCELMGHWPVFGGAVAVVLIGVGMLLAPSALPISGDPVARQSIEVLTEEISVLNESLAVMRLQQASASERLRGVGWIEANGQSNDVLIEALSEVLANDSNVNVRLAVIDALARFAREPEVQKTLIAALEKPQSPLVRIALIETLVPLDLPASREVFQAIAADESNHEAVRERARSALVLRPEESA